MYRPLIDRISLYPTHPPRQPCMPPKTIHAPRNHECPPTMHAPQPCMPPHNHDPFRSEKIGWCTPSRKPWIHHRQILMSIQYKTAFCLSISVISGGSRIFQKGLANPRGCANLLFRITFAQKLYGNDKNWTKRGARVPCAPWLHQCKPYLNALWRYQFKPSIEYSYGILQTVPFSMNLAIFMNKFPETGTSNNGCKKRFINRGGVHD